MNADRIDFSRPKKRETAPSAVPVAKLKAIDAFFGVRTRSIYYSRPHSSPDAHAMAPLLRPVLLFCLGAAAIASSKRETNSCGKSDADKLNKHALSPPYFLQPRRFWYRQGETTCPRSYTGNNSLRRLLLLLPRTR